MTITKETFQIGWLGLAQPLSPAFMHGLAQHPKIKLVDGRWESQSDNAAKAPEPVTLTSDGRALLERIDINAIVLDVPLAQRANLICQAAQHGQTIICPLPIVASLEELEQVEQALARTGARLIAPSALRHHLPLVRAQQALARQALQAPLSLYCARRQKPPVLRPASDVLRTLGPEVIDLLLWLAPAPVVQVYAEAGTLFEAARAEADTALVMLSFADGSTGLVELAWSLPRHYPRAEDLEVEIAAAAGTLLVQPLNQKVTVYGQTSPDTVWDDWATSPNTGLIEEVIESLASQEPSPASFERARQAHAVVAAAQQSAQTAKPVKLVAQNLR